MASLSIDGPNGRYRVTFDRSGRRHTIRLGRVPKKVGEQVRIKVEALIAARRAGTPPDVATAAWAAGLGDELHARLAAVGLVEWRRGDTLGGLLDDYLAGRAADAKSSTLVNLTGAAADLRGHFGADTRLRLIDERRAEAYRTDLLTRVPRLAPATSARWLKWAKQFFRHAAKLKLILANPFAGLSAPVTALPDSHVYVPAEHVRTVIAAADPVWALMIALSRYAAGRMTAHSPKTEHHPGRESRAVPLFPAVRLFLEDARRATPADAVFVVNGPRRTAGGPRPGGPAGGWTSAWPPACGPWSNGRASNRGPGRSTTCGRAWRPA
jgi:hypothetical protein